MAYTIYWNSKGESDRYFVVFISRLVMKVVASMNRSTQFIMQTSVLESSRLEGRPMQVSQHVSVSPCTSTLNQTRITLIKTLGDETKH